MDFSFILDPGYLAYFQEGFVNTLLLVFWSALFGMTLAVLVALGLVAGPSPLRWLLTGFTTVIRGTPLLVQLFFFYDGVGRLLPGIEGVQDSMLWPVLRDAFRPAHRLVGKKADEALDPLDVGRLELGTAPLGAVGGADGLEEDV